MLSLRRLPALVLIALLFGRSPEARAAPSPPLVVVNRSTGQCATAFSGDECTSCGIPEGWEMLGLAGEVECPAGYTLLDQLDVECIPSKDSFCCSEGHSGSQGNCEDLVVNKEAEQCAFVDDVHTCTLPKRWSARPEDVSLYAWVCPAGFEWVSDLACKPPGGETGTGATCPGLGLALPVLAGAFRLARRRPPAPGTAGLWSARVRECHASARPALREEPTLSKAKDLRPSPAPSA